MKNDMINYCFVLSTRFCHEWHLENKPGIKLADFALERIRLLALYGCLFVKKQL